MVDHLHGHHHRSHRCRLYRVHPRMPLAVAPADWSAWLDPAHHDPGELRALLAAPAAGHLDARAVSTAVNDVRNNGPQLLAEPGEDTGNA